MTEPKDDMERPGSSQRGRDEREAREARLAAALKANLQKRKAAARGAAPAGEPAATQGGDGD